MLKIGKLWVFVTIGALALVSLLAIYLRTRPLSTSDAAAQAFDAWTSEDANSIWNSTSEQGRLAYGLSIPKLERLLQVTRIRNQLRPKGEIMVDVDSNTGNATASRWYYRSNGDPILLSQQAELREGRKAVPTDLIASLLLTSFYLEGLKAGANSKPRIMLAGLDSEIPRLQAIGFSGIVVDNSSQVTSWSDLRAQMEARAVRFETQRRSPGSTP